MGLMGLQSLGHQPDLGAGRMVRDDGVGKTSLPESEACQMRLQGASMPALELTP